MRVKTCLKTSLVMSLSLVATVSAAGARIIYVDGGARNGGDGRTWTTAYRYLQDGLAAAGSGDEIRVAEGTYKPDENAANPFGTGKRKATFQLISGVAVYGGFPSGGSEWSERDPKRHETILSGNIGLRGDADNSYHVVTGSGADSNAVLDGFTITAGNADGNFEDASGGGMYNQQGSQTVTNCTFSGNSGTALGGGMYNTGFCSPTVTDCTFSGNSAGGGGGMCNTGFSSPTVTDCTFSGNSAGGHGGGMYNHVDSSPTVATCTFIGNSADDGGGGMCNFYHSSPTVANCTFIGNSADGGGGGMCNIDSSPTAVNCTFSGNATNSDGGGMLSILSDSDPDVICCTFSGNSAVRGGGMLISWGKAGIASCILWGNTASSEGNELCIEGDPSSIGDVLSTVRCSAIAGYFTDIWHPGWPILGNIESDPLFVDADGADDTPGTEDDDLRLSAGSPCIDAGYNSELPEGVVTDIDGQSRIMDGDGNGSPIVDMGAYEYPRAPIEVWVDYRYSADGDNDGHFWGYDAFSTIQDGIDAVEYGATVHVAEGEYRENITLKNGVCLIGTKPTFIVMPWGVATWLRDGTRIVADAPGSVVSSKGCDPNTLLEGFAITNGTGKRVGPEPFTLCGGGMFNVNGSPTVANCTFSNNSADKGGGIYNSNGSPAIMYCGFNDNTADTGGGIHNVGGQAVVSGCSFLYNSADSLGGGVYNESASDTRFVSCRFGNNSAEYGGGMYNDVSDVTIANCTFSRNSIERGGGALANFKSNPRVLNCIMWLDGKGFAVYEIYNNVSTPVITCSDIGGCGGSGVGWDTSLGKDGLGNIDMNPLFTSTLGANYFDVHLSTDSPCIDRGDILVDYTGQTDIDADPRVSGGRVDMGCDEVVRAEEEVPLWSSTLLNPGGGTDDPNVEPLVTFANRSSGTAGVTVVERTRPSHERSGLYRALTGTLYVDTILDDGQFFMTVTINFDKSGLTEGLELSDLNVMYYDPDSQEWVLAVSMNTQHSPGHDGPIGDRFQVVDMIPPTPSADLGDYGVYWNPLSKTGFVWANVDHTSEFGIATAIGVLGDFEPDGDVDFRDMSILASSWSSRPGDAAWVSHCNISAPANNLIDFDDLRVFADNWLAGYAP